MSGNNYIEGEPVPKSILLTSNITSAINDKINYPSHYTDGRIEVIDYIEDKKFNYHLGNAVNIYLEQERKMIMCRT